MNRFRFSIASLLILMTTVAVCAEPVSEFFGWHQPTRQVRRIICFLDSLDEPISYDDFRSKMSLPEIEQYAPLNIPHPDSPDSGYWPLDHGYRLDATYVSDGHLSQVTIGADDDTFLWGWLHGSSGQKDAFEKQLQAWTKP